MAKTGNDAMLGDAQRRLTRERERQAQRDSQTQFYTFEEGETLIRILPGFTDVVKGEDGQEVEIDVPWAAHCWLHFGFGDIPILCPRRMVEEEEVDPGEYPDGADCPPCEFVGELFGSGEKDDEKRARDLYSKHRIYINIIERDDSEAVVHTASIGPMIFNELLAIICDAEYGDITDVYDGTDIKVTRKGKDINTEYSVLAKRSTSRLAPTDEEIDAILDRAPNLLNSIPAAMSFDDMDALVQGKPAPPAEEAGEEAGAAADEFGPGEGVTEEKVAEEAAPPSRRRAGRTTGRRGAASGESKRDVGTDLRDKVEKTRRRTGKSEEAEGKPEPPARRRRRPQ